MCTSASCGQKWNPTPGPLSVSRRSGAPVTYLWIQNEGWTALYQDISLVLSDSGVDTVVDFRAVYSFSGKILP